MKKYDITGIILAGGYSSRFGSNKALIKIGSQTLIERVASQIGALFSEVIIVTNEPLLYAELNTTVVTDIIPHQGPLGGIYTGLLYARFPHAFVVACDMPFINTMLVRYIVERINSFDVVVPRADDKYEPLYAVYGKICIKPMRRLLEMRKRQVIEVFKYVRVKTIEKEEICKIDREMKCFFNINTMPDWKHALREYEERRGNTDG